MDEEEMDLEKMDLEKMDLEYNVEGKKLPAKIYRGELFDITVTSYNNVFGKAKIDYSLHNGIKFKMDYFIDELTKITSDKLDDKSIKRFERKDFLEKCKTEGSVFFKSLFNLLIKYLNGGMQLDYTKNEYDKQSFIVVLMGGNIINIYFNILYFTMIDIDEQNINFISDFFNDNDIPGLKQRMYAILKGLKSWSKENPTFITFINKKKDTGLFNSYSDLDFSLLPNKINYDFKGGVRSRPPEGFYSNKKIKERGEQMDKHDTKLKSSVSKHKATKSKANPKASTSKASTSKASTSKASTSKAKPKANPKASTRKQSVEKTIDKKTKVTDKKILEEKKEIIKKNNEFLESSNGFLLYRIKTNFAIFDKFTEASNIPFFQSIKLENDKINDTYKSTMFDCNINDLTKLGLKYRKDLIAHLAQQDWLSKDGVLDKCKKFIKNLLAKKERTKKCTNKNTEIICNDDGINQNKTELEKLKNLINFIRILTKKINTHLFVYGTIADMELLSIFDNLYSILDNKNKLVIKMCNSIVEQFYDIPETKKVINNINKFYNQIECRSKNFTCSSFNISKYEPFKYIIFKVFKKNPKEFTEREGTILTINLIFPDEVKEIKKFENENDFFDSIENEILYEQAIEASNKIILESNRLYGEGKKKRKANALTRKCKNKKYRKKHTKKCKKFLKG